MTTIDGNQQPNGLRYVELDPLSSQILAVLAKEPATSFSLRYLKKELGAPSWKDVARCVKEMEQLNYVEYGGIGRGSTAAYNISDELLRSPIRNRLL